MHRQLLWDPKKEEAIVLITWASISDWKAIPQLEIDRVQEQFEKTAHELTNKQGVNPFPLTSEAELIPQ